MIGQVPIVQRAFQLAGSGDCLDWGEVALCLAREGYVDVEAHLVGPLLRRQLREACRKAAAERRIGEHTGSEPADCCLPLNPPRPVPTESPAASH